MWYRIIERRPSSTRYGQWQPVMGSLVVSLGRRENEVEFADRPILRGQDESVRCRCALRSRGHRHRLDPVVDSSGIAAGRAKICRCSTNRGMCVFKTYKPGG
jgi:hypothetical protein